MTQGADAAVLRQIFNYARTHGVELRLLFDDDMWWAARQSTPGRYMNDAYEYRDWVTPLEIAGASVRFLVTNHHSARRNFVHGKLIIFELRNGMRAVLVGSANLTEAALYNNIEHVYILESADVPGEIVDWFDRAWTISRSGRDFPIIDVAPR